MFCHNCGEKLDDFAIYCEYCGVKVRKEEATKIFSESGALNQYYELEYELEDINEELTTLPAKQAYLNRLMQARDQKGNQLQQIRQVMLKEKKDYDSLLKLSFSSIKARLSGDLDEKKRREEAEYLEALANFEYVEKEYKNLDDDAKKTQVEINRIQELKTRIPVIEKEMEELLVQLTTGKTTDKLKRFELQNEQIQNKLRRAREIENQFIEADSLLQQAENYLDNSLNKLRSAEGLGTWDIFFRGGFFVDAMKHGDLNSAKNDINQAQTLIRRAKDLVDIIDEIYIDFEAPNMFFDMFFDNFFFDMFGNAKIHRTRERVELAFDNLHKSRNTLNQYLSKWQQNRNELVLQANDIRKQIREERVSLL
ncbi:MAG: zinc ribbon domain-containing protein [Promethearchaeota archaeon]